MRGPFVFHSLLLFWVARGRVRVLEQRALCRGLFRLVRGLVLLFIPRFDQARKSLRAGTAEGMTVLRYFSVFAQKNVYFVSLLECDVELFFCLVCVWNQECLCPVDSCGPFIFDVQYVFSSGGQASDGDTCGKEAAGVWEMVSTFYVECSALVWLVKSFL